jgi:hypothetical protein
MFARMSVDKTKKIFAKIWSNFLSSDTTQKYLSPIFFGSPKCIFVSSILRKGKGGA